LVGKPLTADRLTARFPIIPGITGMVREKFIAENTGLLGDSNIQELSEERFVGTLVYPVADPGGVTLTVRQREGDPRLTPAGLEWRLVDDRHVEITQRRVSLLYQKQGAEGGGSALTVLPRYCPDRVV
jgi:hypothetical protein